MRERVLQHAVLLQEPVDPSVDLGHLLLAEAAVLAALRGMETVGHTGSVECLVNPDGMLVGHDLIGVAT